jgi:hypothetical protein
VTVVLLSSVAACAGAQQQVERLLLAGERVAVVVECTDLAVVDALARMRLLADRLQGSLTVLGDRELLCLCGLGFL